MTDVVENPPGLIVRAEAQKAAFDNGFRIDLGMEGGWMRFGSATAQGDVWIAGASYLGPWFLAVGHSGVANELDAGVQDVCGPGVARFIITSLPELYVAIERAYRLGVSLPDAPLAEFGRRIAGMPRTTEAERLVVQRIGQDVFRAALLDIGIIGAL